MALIEVAKHEGSFDPLENCGGSQLLSVTMSIKLVTAIEYDKQAGDCSIVIQPFMSQFCYRLLWLPWT
jgi:hypothetical protein